MHSLPRCVSLAIAFGLVPGLVAQVKPEPTPGDQPGSVTGKSAPAAATGGKAAEDFRTAARELDRQYSRCAKCKGKGKIENDICSDCDGDGLVFHGDLQKHLDGYVAYCELIEKYPAELAADKAGHERVLKYQARYLRTLRARTGSRDKLEGVGDEKRTVTYHASGQAVGDCNKLACALVVQSPSRMLNKAIAFGGKVREVLTAKDTGESPTASQPAADAARPAAAPQALAAVRIAAPEGEVRTCYVPVPAGRTWEPGQEVRVVGRIVSGTAERKAFELPAGVVVVQPVHGTE